MLITNFAAGELAETLFGRTDLGQYYSGVSHLENFDVIPTGGISRRHGMKRIRKMGGEGRIIPFILNREESFLLFLTPRKIQIFREGTLLNTVESSDAVPLYSSMAEINDVQYAQNYDKMVLAHENYVPLLIKLEDEILSVEKFAIDTRLTINGSDEINKAPYQEEKDETYKENHYLDFSEPGNFPRCVSFFQGRLVFAGTKNNPQRIFASKVSTGGDDIHSFATSQMFLTEQRKYIAVTATLIPLSRIAELEDPNDSMKFLEDDPKKFKYSGDYFPADTYVEKVDGVNLTLSKKTNFQGLTDAERAALIAWRDDGNDIEDELSGNSLVPIYYPDRVSPGNPIISYQAKFGLFSIQIYRFTTYGDSEFNSEEVYGEIFINKFDAASIQAESSTSPDVILEKIRSVQSISDGCLAGVTGAAQTMSGNIRQYMYKTFR
jgi:hypothetical protein